MTGKISRRLVGIPRRYYYRRLRDTIDFYIANVNSEREVSPVCYIRTCVVPCIIIFSVLLTMFGYFFIFFLCFPFCRRGGKKKAAPPPSLWYYNIIMYNRGENVGRRVSKTVYSGSAENPRYSVRYRRQRGRGLRSYLRNFSENLNWPYRKTIVNAGDENRFTRPLVFSKRKITFYTHPPPPPPPPLKHI